MADYENQDQANNRDDYQPQPGGQAPENRNQGQQPQKGSGEPNSPNGWNNGQQSQQPQWNQAPYHGQPQQNWGPQDGQNNGGPYGGPNTYGNPGGPYGGPNNPYGGPGGPYGNPNSPYGAPAPKQKNTFATVSILCGIFGILTLCCCAFPLSIILGVGAISFAVLSKQGRPFTGFAIAGIILGVVCIIGGVVEFIYVMAVSALMRDPEYASMFNQIYEQMQQQIQSGQ